MCFYKCKSKKKLARLLKTDLNNLNRLSKSIEQEYYTFNNKRQITALKRVESYTKRVLNLLNKIEKPDWVISSTKEKSYLDNAHYHIELNMFVQQIFVVSIIIALVIGCINFCKNC